MSKTHELSLDLEQPVEIKSAIEDAYNAFCTD